MRPRLCRVAVALLLLLGAALAPACRGAPPAAPSLPPPSPPPTPGAAVRLPADEAPHPGGFEWWYFNVSLSAQGGADYGLHYVVFQAPAAPLPGVWLAQVGLTDVGKGRFLAADRLAPAADPPARGFRFDLPGWLMEGSAGRYRLRASLEGYSFDLTVRALKPPVLHDGDGLVDLGEGGKSYYYSWTRLEAQGTLTDGGRPRRVQGSAWMDHQWGPFQPAQLGWDWFGLQLDDGSDLLLARVRGRDGRPVGAFGTYVGLRGQPRYLDGAAFAISSQGSWASPATGVVYPLGWRLEVPSRGLSLALEPLVREGEVPASGAFTPPYWEGPVRVRGWRQGHPTKSQISWGPRQGRPLTGRGFVELVGYGRGTPSR